MCKGVLNVLGGVLVKSYLLFYGYDSVSLILRCKLASLYNLVVMYVKQIPMQHMHLNNYL